MYLEHLRREQDSSILFVSACDKLANIRSILKDYRDIGDQVFKRFNVSKAETLAYYSELAQILDSRISTGLTRELALAVSELVRLAGVEVV
jgi:hypothetical protein